MGNGQGHRHPLHNAILSAKMEKDTHRTGVVHVHPVVAPEAGDE
jgi:hypothetical protein